MICVDASVAVKWVLAEEWSAQARALYDAAVAVDEAIIAPPLLTIEVTNILYQRTRIQGGLSLREASILLDRFMRHETNVLDPDGLAQHALALAHHYGLPAAYDAHYLALAESFGCAFWTDDHRLLRAVGVHLPFVRPISEYGLPSRLT